MRQARQGRSSFPRSTVFEFGGAGFQRNSGVKQASALGYANGYRQQILCAFSISIASGEAWSGTPLQTNLVWASIRLAIGFEFSRRVAGPASKRITQASGARTYQSRMTEILRIVSSTRREVRPTCSFPIAKQSTFPAVTWLSAGVGWRSSMDLIRNSGKPVTT